MPAPAPPDLPSTNFTPLNPENPGPIGDWFKTWKTSYVDGAWTPATHTVVQWEFGFPINSSAWEQDPDIPDPLGHNLVFYRTYAARYQPG